jgi:hypothetical protein
MRRAGDGTGGSTPPAGSVSVDGLRRGLNERIAQSASDPEGQALFRAQLAGMRSVDRAPVRDVSGMSPKERAAYLAGHLHAYAARGTGRIGKALLLPMTAYAGTLVSPGASERLADPTEDGLVRAHTYTVARIAGTWPLAGDGEEIAFRWLAEQLDVRVTPALLERRVAFAAGVAERRARAATEGPFKPTRIERLIDAAAEGLRSQLATLADDSEGAELVRGALDGLAIDDVSLFASEHESRARHAGLLGGFLLASLVRDGWSPGAARLAHACHRYAGALASAQGRAYLVEAPPRNLLKAHELGWWAARRDLDPRLGADLDFALFGWLAARLGVAMTPELIEMRGRVRAVPRRKPEA